MSMGIRMTRRGNNLLAQGLTGLQIKFTKVAIGDGHFDYENESVLDLTALRSWKMDLPLVGIKIVGDGTVTLSALLNNAELADGFCAREHGIFAEDPITGEEFLYSYKNSGEEYEYIPSNTGSVKKVLTCGYTTVIQDAPNVTAVLNASFAYVAQTEFEEHVKDEHPHPNTPNHYLDAFEIDNLWGTDRDNHLHKISVENLKYQLREDKIEDTKANDAAEIALARDELGLNANVMLIEDLVSPSTLDTFKTKVTSCARGGNLVGVENAEGLKTGAYFWISDGINQELIKVVSVMLNISGYHAKIETGLDYSYDAASTYLYRTTATISEGVGYGTVDQRTHVWQPVGFTGVEANIARTIPLDTSLKKANDFDVTGDGILTIDGFFTLEAG